MLVISRLTEENYVRKCLGHVIDTIPIVAARFPRVRYVLFGSASDSRVVCRIQDRARELGVRDHLDLLTEPVSEAEKIRYMHASTVYLQPTLYEGFGLAIAEAMSCGLPVVTSRSGSVPEVVADAGVYCDPNDVRDIAGKTMEILSDQMLQAELGKKGRLRIEQHFSYERRKTAIHRIIESLLGRRDVRGCVA